MMYDGKLFSCCSKGNTSLGESSYHLAGRRGAIDQVRSDAKKCFAQIRHITPTPELCYTHNGAYFVVPHVKS